MGPHEDGNDHPRVWVHCRHAVCLPLLTGFADFCGLLSGLTDLTSIVLALQHIRDIDCPDFEG